MCERSASPYHLLLDTGTLNTTKVKMKRLQFITALLIIGLLAQCGLAKPNTRNERTRRQTYLPPPPITSNGPRIREEYITIHENDLNGQAQFQETTNYENGKYQILEIHNHYEPSAVSNFNAPQYLPPQHEIRVPHVQQTYGTNNYGGIDYQHVANPAVPIPFPSNFKHDFQKTQTAHAQEEVIRVQHIHVTQPQPSAQRIADLPLNSGTQEHENQPQTQNQEFKGPDYLPPHHEQHNNEQENVQGTNYAQPYQSNQLTAQHGIETNQLSAPAYTPPHQITTADYSPPHREQTNHNDQQQVQRLPSFRGPRVYVPPQADHEHNYEQQIQSNSFTNNAQNYLPPHDGQQIHQQVQTQQSYTASNHLPLHTEQQVQPQQDYLPPHQEQHGQHQVAMRDYFPPQQEQLVQSQKDYLPPHQEQQIQTQQSYRAPAYLPPHQEQHAQQQVQAQKTYTTRDYFPPQQEQQVQPQQDYLPPHQEQHAQQQVQTQQSYTAPDYLPPHQEQHTHVVQDHNIPPPSALPADYEPKIPAVQSIAPQNPTQETTLQLPLSQPTPQHLPAALSLPPGYDFVKPENSEAAIAELHTLPNENPNSNQQEVNVQTQIKVTHGAQSADIVYGSQKSYHPPHQTTNNYEVKQSNVKALTSPFSTVQQSSHQHNVQQLLQKPPSNYLPPTTTPVQTLQYNSNLNSLSNYMSSVEPFQRYASTPRQPFPVYGPPSITSNTGAFTQQQPQQQHYKPIQIPPIAPMYTEQTTRAPYYAPAMSYATNALANSNTSHHKTSQHHGFNQATKNNLQRFMPTDVRAVNYAASAPDPATATYTSPTTASQPTAIHSASSVPIHQYATSKLRTVQILNPTAVKTLKVLETSDHAGVKTIKILGASNTPPTDEHRIVKVVTKNSANSDEQIQTLKIFNDHIELSNNDVTSSNGYLPPTTRVVRQSPLIINKQLISNQKYRHPFAGRNHYRLFN